MVASELKDCISPVFDEEVLKKILRKSSGCVDVSVKNVEIKDANTNKGDSYLSSVVRFSVYGFANDKENEEIKAHVIVKTIPKNVARKHTFRSHDFFKNEVAFYNDVWDALLQFQETKNLKNPFNNIPICLAALADGENDYVALEDLNCQSFTTFKRQGAMDYETVLTIMRLFARFHALSFAFKDQHPKEFEKIADSLHETYFAEKHRNWYIDFNKTLINVSRDAVLKELPDIYLEQFDKVFQNDSFGRICAMMIDHKKSKYSLITQGDAWIPNFLCKYSETNQLEEIKLIDFQLSRCTSAVSDLTFFLYACASYDLLSKYWNEILKEYHTTFCAFLAELGSSPDIYPLSDLKDEFKKSALYGIGMAMEAIPFQMMDDSETADLDAIQGEEAVPITTVWKVYPIKSQEGRQRLANVIKHAVDNDFL